MNVILGLGTNTGDRRLQLKRAARALTPLLSQMRCSPVYTCAALLPEHAPEHWNKPFLNMAVRGETRLTPQELLAAVKAIERDLGRVARGHWGPREIDIDILACEDTVINHDDLIIPHAGLLLRDFALVPLADIAPDWRYPYGEQKGKTARALAHALKSTLQPTDTTFCLTQLMGVVNLTPDSFSGDGVLQDTGAALAQIEAMQAAGASVIDIGAESTRPGAALLTPQEEWQRLSSLLGALGTRLQTGCFSVDTRHAATAQKALAMGVRWINDVSGSHEKALLKHISACDATLVLTHSLSVPADPTHTLPADADPVDSVFAWGQQRIAELEQDGIGRSQIVFDPGIGFGKTPEQSFALLHGISRFKALGVPLLVGHSRKSFLSLFSDNTAGARDGETHAVSSFLALQGVDYLRVHDVAGHAMLLRITDALL